MNPNTQNDICLIKNFQNIIFSPNCNDLFINEEFNEEKTFFSPNEIDHQLILSFSLDYHKIPIFKSLLSKSNLEEKDFFHFDQELLFHLIQSNISFPILSIRNNIMNLKDRIKKLKIEQYLSEELQKKNQLKEIESYCSQNRIKIKIREKIKIEEIIEQDDIESLKIFSNSNNLDFNQKIKKNNELFHYARIPILLLCIEKSAMKCFKFVLINGADPTLKSEKFKSKRKEYKPVWDAYGFAGARGNIHVIRILKENGIKPSNYLLEGCSQFHQKQILELIINEESYLLNPEKDSYLFKSVMKKTIFFENFEFLDLFILKRNINSILINENDQTSLHYAAKKNRKKIGELLISKGADINARDIIYLNNV